MPRNETRKRAAPFLDSTTDLWLFKAGYMAKQVIVDRKAFLVSQTRNWGYLVAIDSKLYGDATAISWTTPR